MKTISYTLGILALLTMMSSCTIEELELANELQGTAVIEQTENDGGHVIECTIDPPKIPPVR